MAAQARRATRSESPAVGAGITASTLALVVVRTARRMKHRLLLFGLLLAGVGRLTFLLLEPTPEFDTLLMGVPTLLIGVAVLALAFSHPEE
jgi:hypothetical protein